MQCTSQKMVYKEHFKILEKIIAIIDQVDAWPDLCRVQSTVGSVRCFRYNYYKTLKESNITKLKYLNQIADFTKTYFNI